MVHGPRARVWRPGASAVVAALVVVTAAAGVALRGGFTDAGRGVTVALAALACVVAVHTRGDAIAAELRGPVMGALVGLGLLLVVSVGWTPAGARSASTAALVVLGYAALVLAVRVAVADARVIVPVAAAIVVLAAAAAIVGLVACALRVEPFAQRIGGSWRPGGPFEYPPALALLQITAMPAVLSAMTTAPRRIAGLAALAGAAGTSVVFLSDGRLPLAAWIVVAVIAVACSESLGADRARMTLAVASLLAVGVVVHLAAGGAADPGDTAGGTTRLATLAAVLASASLLWAVVLRTCPLPSVGLHRRWAALVAVAATLGSGMLLLAASSGPVPEADGGVLHGRAQLWDAGLRAFGDAPLFGHGAGSFLQVSAPYQDNGPVRYAHSLPIEMLVEVGPTGFLLIVVLFVGTVIAVVRSEVPVAWWFGTGAIAFLVTNLVDWSWHLAGCGAVYAIAVGCCLGRPRQSGSSLGHAAGHAGRADGDPTAGVLADGPVGSHQA